MSKENTDTDADRPTKPAALSAEVTNWMIEDTIQIKPSRVADITITLAKNIKFMMAEKISSQNRQNKNQNI